LDQHTHQQDNEALNPRTRGDWDVTNSPLPPYRGNCPPGHPHCPCPACHDQERPGFARSPTVWCRLGTPSPPLPSLEDTLVGPGIGGRSDVNNTSAAGPARR